MQLHSCSVRGYNCPCDGGGVLASGSSLLLVNTSLFGNTAIQGGGIAIKSALKPSST